MKRKILAGLTLVAMLSLEAIAQNSDTKFSFEFSGGVSIPTRELGNSILNHGVGFEGVFHFRFLPHLGVYGGWGWNKLSADDSYAGVDVSFEETGYVLGLQFLHPIGDSPISYYVRGAGLYKHIETENAEGDIIDDTGHGFGFEAACGVDYYLGKNWSFNAGIKYSSLSRDTNFEGNPRNLDYQYISLRVGILKHF